MLSQIKSTEEIESMRQAGKILAQGLKIMASSAQPGISTKELSDIAANHIASCGAKPAFLNYPGAHGTRPFPEVACISVNDAVVHGIPTTQEILKDGDIVSLDLGVIVNGMVVDGAITVGVGKIHDRDNELIETTKKALSAGLKKVKNNCQTGDIGSEIERILNQKSLGIVRDLVGHGVGYSVHEDPNIPNYGTSGTGSWLKSGMTIAVEPMATKGTHKIFIDKDGWTVRTQDQSRSAHFEHTVVVTDKGCEILTLDS